MRSRDRPVLSVLVTRRFCDRTTSVVLEPAANEFAQSTAAPPLLFDLGPVEGRKVVDALREDWPHVREALDEIGPDAGEMAR
jgi:hypothetical protein